MMVFKAGHEPSITPHISTNLNMLIAFNRCSSSRTVQNFRPQTVNPTLLEATGGGSFPSFKAIKVVAKRRFSAVKSLLDDPGRKWCPEQKARIHSALDMEWIERFEAIFHQHHIGCGHPFSSIGIPNNS